MVQHWGSDSLPNAAVLTRVAPRLICACDELMLHPRAARVHRNVIAAARRRGYRGHLPHEPLGRRFPKTMAAPQRARRSKWLTLDRGCRRRHVRCRAATGLRIYRGRLAGAPAGSPPNRLAGANRPRQHDRLGDVEGQPHGQAIVKGDRRCPAGHEAAASGSLLPLPAAGVRRKQIQPTLSDAIGSSL
jgi:hypothetical protein